MKTIIEILGVFDTDITEMAINESFRIERSGFNDLIIEKVGDDRLSVAQVYTQRGDLMRDPEIVFDLSDGEWTAVEYQHDPVEYQHDESGLPDVQRFAGTWNTNLRKQGFVAAAKEQASA